MNKEVKNKWIEALKSGEYNQATAALCKESPDGSRRFCCLGVLTDLYIKEHGETSWIKDTHRYPCLAIALAKGLSSEILGYNQISRDFGNVELVTGSLPRDVQIWAGLDDDDPEVNTHQSLAELNDGGCSFKRIASIIEEQL